MDLLSVAISLEIDRNLSYSQRLGASIVNVAGNRGREGAVQSVACTVCSSKQISPGQKKNMGR